MSQENQRKFVTKKEILFFVFIGILLYLVIFLFPMKKTGDIIATVYYQSEKYTEINLTQALDGETLEIMGDLPVHLVVKNHCIAFVNAQCPDKVCEQYGYIGRPGQQAVCLPAKVSIIIDVSTTGVDMISD